MDFEVPQELQMIVDTVAEFRSREMQPLEKDFLAAGELPLEARVALEQTAREKGLWALEVPEADGGAGLGLMACAMINEELAKCAIPFAFGGTIFPSSTATGEAVMPLPNPMPDRTCRGSGPGRFRMATDGS